MLGTVPAQVPVWLPQHAPVACSIRWTYVSVGHLSGFIAMVGNMNGSSGSGSGSPSSSARRLPPPPARQGYEHVWSQRCAWEHVRQ
eukprot:SAG11_NODE_2394_length_3407_cov_1.720677_3_plen_86_part_00